MLECQECAKYLYAFLDGALDVKESLDVQEHLHACQRCADRVEAERALKAFVRQHAVTPPLPEPHKQQIIQNAMRASSTPRWWKPRNMPVHLRDMAIGAGAAAAVLFVVLRPVLHTTRANDPIQKLSREASMAYSVYTSQDRPPETARTSNPAVVEWIKSHTGSRHTVPWITEQGAQFVGEGFCRILDRKSAVLVYRRPDADVLLFAFKGEPLSPSTKNMVRTGEHALYMQTVSGRPVAIWQHDGMTYSMVGNLPRHALLQLATAIDYR
jgi:anti-sigma factor RsiW